MSYVSRSETGATESGISHPGEVLIRKLTESQGGRSEYYDTRDVTNKARPALSTLSRQRSTPPPQRLPSSKAPSLRARTEHAERLLRECQNASADLVDAFGDPVRSAVLGSTLVSLLNELWRYRQIREADWVELLNLLQLMLAKQEFEGLSQPKRAALASVFREHLTGHPTGPADVRRALETLAQSGFDVWAGLEEAQPPG